MENTKLEKEIDTAFLVVQHTDGTFGVHLELPKEDVTPSRVATAADVQQLCNNILKEIDMQQLTERIAATLIQLLQPPVEQSVPDKVAEKLKERGITPDK